MGKSNHFIRAAGAIGLLCFGAIELHGDPAPSDKAPAAIKLPADARVVNGQSGLPRLGELHAEAWAPGVNTEQGRGLSESVYPKVAPAVVVVKLPNGHGTGFVVDADGWILTNNHVAVEAPPDPETGIPTVDIFFGRLQGKWMKLDSKPVRREVYKVDPGRDLALLKLKGKPAGMDKLPVVPLAAENPGPGSDCIAIGHPASSALWTVREGQVTGLANWPGDRTEDIITRLSLGKSDAAEMTRQLKTAPKREVLITNTGVNSGDSGGPLVNSHGELIAVTFAMPAFDPESQRRQGTTSYHVHVDEVREFLKNRPSEPVQFTDAWPDAMMAGLVRSGANPSPDALVFSPARNAAWVALLVDLAQESTGELNLDKISDPEERAKWHFTFAYHREPFHRAFYDTKHSGHIDLIVTDVDGDGEADSVVRLVDGRWKAEAPEGRRLLDPGYFEDPDLRKGFARVMRALQQQQQ